MSGGTFYQQQSKKGRDVILEQPDLSQDFAIRARKLQAAQKGILAEKDKNIKDNRTELDKLKVIHDYGMSQFDQQNDAQYQKILDEGSTVVEQYNAKGERVPDWAMKDVYRKAYDYTENVKHQQKLEQASNFYRQQIWDTYRVSEDKDQLKNNMQTYKDWLNMGDVRQMSDNPPDFDYTKFNLQKEYTNGFKQTIKAQGIGGVTDNGDGTMTITNPSEITQADVDKYNKSATTNPKFIQAAKKDWANTPEIQKAFPNGPEDYIKAIGQPFIYEKQTESVHNKPTGGTGTGGEATGKDQYDSQPTNDTEYAKIFSAMGGGTGDVWDVSGAKRSVSLHGNLKGWSVDDGSYHDLIVDGPYDLKKLANLPNSKWAVVHGKYKIEDGIDEQGNPKYVTKEGQFVIDFNHVQGAARSKINNKYINLSGKGNSDFGIPTGDQAGGGAGGTTTFGNNK